MENMDLLDYSTSDLNTDLWDSDLDPTMQDQLKLSADPDMQDWFLDRDSKIPQVILNDKLMTDAIIGSLPIKTEHSYSLNSDGDTVPDSPDSLHNKMDDMDECYPAISMTTAVNGHKNVHNVHNNNNNNNYINYLQTLQQNNVSLHNNNNNNHHHNNNNSNSNLNNSNINNNNNNNSSLINSNNVSVLHSFKFSHKKKGSDVSSTTSGSDFELDSTDEATIKEEPMSPGSSCPPSPTQCGAGYTVNLANMAAYTNSDLVFDHKNGTVHMSNGSQSLLKNQHVLVGSGSHRIVIPKVKLESQSGFGLPPTPPSSLPSDESEGNQSPEHMHAPLSPQAPSTTSSRRTSMNNNSSSRGYTSGSSSRQPIHTPLISSQPKGSTGNLMLTEEEKRTLLAEGYPIPTRLPLTKAEEKSLKKIRRKIKNKISAQESRRKKKEYMDQLERKVEILVNENSDYKKRVESLEDDNASLMSQLARLQALINKQTSRSK